MLAASQHIEREILIRVNFRHDHNLVHETQPEQADKRRGELKPTAREKADRMVQANRAQDGHPGNSSPLDEQVFIVNTINFLQSLPDWDSTLVIVTYDDSNGWYDHAMSPILDQSNSAQDALTGTSACGNGANALEAIQGRCGYGPRLPFLVISPFAKNNYVDSTLLDQSSVPRFIEENWSLPQIGNGSFDQFAGTIFNMLDFKNPNDNKVILNPSTGQVVNSGKGGK